MIDFLKYRYVCFAFSLVLFLSGAVAYVAKGGFKYHIDFVGGTEINIAFENPVKISELRGGLSKKGWKDLTIQSIGFADSNGSHKEFMVRVGGSEANLESRFKKDSSSVIKDNKLEIRGISSVGSEAGSDIRWNAFVSIFLSLLIIVLYIAIMRAGYSYAAGSVVALVHDMLVLLVIFLFLDMQISVGVLAALLAIFGYSLNDTIVIFSRIRENFKKHSDRSEYDIVNMSLNQTLRRTLLTSFSTLLTVVSVLVLGGESLSGFATAMVVGVIFGTYSSIYIASPVMLAFGSAKN